MNTSSLVSPQAVTAADFPERVLAASVHRLVLVDVWAAWCGPCKALAPILDEVARQEAERLTVVKVDADAEPDVAAQFGVRALPTLLFFRNGDVVDRLVGLHPASALRAKVDALSTR